MIGKLTGQVTATGSDSILIETHGVGYEVFVHQRFLDGLHSNSNRTFSIWIHSHIREDAFQLFGFETIREKEFFLGLLKFNGVGPKLALNVLSGASLETISKWIESADIKALTQLPKVGKKIAEQMILQLKGKLVRADDSPSGGLGSKAQRSVSSEVTSALENLGYRGIAIHEVVATLSPDISFEEGLRRSLTLLSQSPEQGSLNGNY